ncbi:MAG TPA: hypothetical protein VM115_14325 [Vicinamibacterales bacterium]|nr:hypothetical protein [Vicinamibacterales bacterium]
MKKLQISALVLGLVMASAASEAQTQPARQTTPQRPQMPAAPAAPAQGQTSPGMFMPETRDARETRDRLNEIFQQYPPSVKEVLRLDPTLMYRPDYIANYPMLAAFLEQHSEIAHNPSFFVGERRFDEQSDNPRMEMARALRNMGEVAGVALIIMVITTGIVFLVKTVVEHRRWQRAMKAQNDLNTKLIDRFASSEDLLAYIQSPQGKVLTEGPIMPQAASRAIGAPLSRIFWSIQSGIVLGALGAGLMFVSSTGEPEVATFLHGVGVVVLMIGIGFTVSAVVSYVLSQRLGLVQTPPARYSGDVPTP